MCKIVLFSVVWLVMINEVGDIYGIYEISLGMLLLMFGRFLFCEKLFQFMCGFSFFEGTDICVSSNFMKFIYL